MMFFIMCSEWTQKMEKIPSYNNGLTNESAATSGSAAEILEATNLNMIYLSMMNVVRL